MPGLKDGRQITLRYLKGHDIWVPHNEKLSHLVEAYDPETIFLTSAEPGRDKSLQEVPWTSGMPRIAARSEKNRISNAGRLSGIRQLLCCSMHRNTRAIFVCGSGIPMA